MGFVGSSSKSKCCGHHCPLCNSVAHPLAGYMKDKDGKRREADMPWRFEIGRIAHKCRKKHRFDIHRETGQPLPDYVLRLPDKGKEVFRFPVEQQK